MSDLAIGLGLVGMLALVPIIILLALSYFVFIGIEGVIVHVNDGKSVHFIILLIITLVVLFLGLFSKLMFIADVILALYGLVLFFS